MKGNVKALVAALAAGMALASQGSIRALQRVEPRLDVHYVVDMSSSITQADPLCVMQSGLPCWSLAVDYIGNITMELVNNFGQWADGPNSDSGVQFGITTFSCEPKTYIPITENITDNELKHSDIALAGAMYILEEAIVPFGGTCPSEALGYVYDSLLNAPSFRDQQMILILTDGLITPADLNRTKAIAQSIQETECYVCVVSIGYNNGWNENVTKEIFGESAKLMSVEDFSSLKTSVEAVLRGVEDAFNTDNNGNGGNGGDNNNNGGSGLGDSGSNAGQIAGAVIGSICAVALVVGGVILVKKRQQEKKDEVASASGSLVPSA